MGVLGFCTALPLLEDGSTVVQRVLPSLRCLLRTVVPVRAVCVISYVFLNKLVRGNEALVFLTEAAVRKWLC